MAQVALGDASGGRERLVREAFTLFAERGFDAVTVRDIAAASRVSVGLINHHFGSKEGLRNAVDEYFMEQFEDVFLDLKNRQEDNSSEGFALAIDDWISRHESSWPSIVAYFRRAILQESDWGYSIFLRFYSFVQGSVMRMDAAGRIGPDVDRLWLPFLMMYLELGTMVFDPYIRRVTGRSGYDRDLWRRRHRAYMTLIRRGSAPSRSGT